MSCKAKFQYRDSITPGGSVSFRLYPCMLEENHIEKHETLLPTFSMSLNEERHLLETTSLFDLPHGILSWDDSVSYKRASK